MASRHHGTVLNALRYVSDQKTHELSKRIGREMSLAAVMLIDAMAWGVPPPTETRENVPVDPTGGACV